MKRPSVGRCAGLVLGLALSLPAAGVELAPPAIASVMTWTCSGPFTTEYRVKVMKIDDDMVTYQGRRDDDSYWTEKFAWLTGTTLWSRKSGDQHQWFDKEDFENYVRLEPGARFKGAVPAREGDDKWVWDYVITVDEAQNLEHALLGDIRIVPITEERRIYHGTYWSNMTSFVLPEKGLTVRWIYEDPRGLEDCDLTGLDAKGQIIIPRSE
jgi:hypothetical protein